MAEKNYEIDLQDFMTDDILELMKNNCIDPNDELVDLSGELETINAKRKRRLLSLPTKPPLPSEYLLKRSRD